MGGMVLLVEKCGKPPILDSVIARLALPEEAVRELSQHNVHLNTNIFESLF
jgi:hypothetical protein